MGVDKQRLEAAIKELLLAVGEDPTRNGLIDTPRRVASMYEEVFAGLSEDPKQHLKVSFEANHDEMVLIRDISFSSMCEHHLVPFIGKVNLAYLPGDEGRIVGLSKLARLVEGFSRRPQVQERLTTQLADAMQEGLETKGVMVVISAEHLCMSIRGVKKPGAITVTSAVRGLFRTNAATRAEAMDLLHRN